MGDAKKELFDLSIAQRELTLGHFLPDRSDLVNMLGFHVYMEADCHLDLLEKCWNRILEMNDTLRLRIVRGFKRRQYVEPYVYETLPVINADGAEGFKALEKKERSVAVRMFGGALYRVTLVDCGNGAGGMIACLHNICCDGYSLEMIFKEMENLYATLLRSEEFPPYKEYSYVEYLKQEKKYIDSGEYKEDCAWWRKKYLHLRHYTIPVGYPSGKVQTGMVTVQTSPEQYEKLTAFCKENSTPITSAIMSAMAVATYFLTKKTCFGFYNLSHGRRTYAMKHTMGCITAVNPVFFQIDPEMSFSQMAKRDYMEYLEALHHGRMPCLNHIVCSYLQSVKLGFNFYHHWMFFSPMGLGGLANESKLGLEVFDESELENQFYCAVYDMPDENAIRLELNYQSAKFSAKQMENVERKFEKILYWCLEHPNNPLEKMEIGK